MMYFRGIYIQKGYGIGGLFNTYHNLLKPIVKKLVTLIKKTEVKEILKTGGKAGANIGTEMLIRSMKGKVMNNPTVQRKIEEGKRKLMRSVEEGISSLNTPKKKKKHQVTYGENVVSTNRNTHNEIPVGRIERAKCHPKRGVRWYRKSISPQTVFD